VIGRGEPTARQEALQSQLIKLGAEVVKAPDAKGARRPHLVVADFCGVATPTEAAGLILEQIQPLLLGGLRPNGRVLFLTSEGLSPASAAVASGLGGFVRSLAKELGSNGTTVNMIRYVSAS
jgi:hypothetical protein